MHLHVSKEKKIGMCLLPDRVMKGNCSIVCFIVIDWMSWHEYDVCSHLHSTLEKILEKEFSVARLG